MVISILSPILGLTLLVAGAGKFRDLDGHVRVVQGYKVLPDSVAKIIGRALPLMEVLLGAALLFGLDPIFTGSAAAVLFLAYAAGLTVNLLRGRTELDCGCFAFGDHNDAPTISWFHAMRAGFFASLGVLVVIAAQYLPPATIGEQLAGIAVAALVVALAFGVSAVLSVFTPGKARVDNYLAPARDELRRRTADPAAPKVSRNPS